MRETQATISQWMNDTFPGADPDSPRKAIRALEEMVELCLAAGATPNQIHAAVRDELHKRSHGPGLEWRDQSYGQSGAIPAEAADVAIVLYGVAHIKGFDLQAEIDRKMAINRARNWIPRGDGTGYHKKPGSHLECNGSELATVQVTEDDGQVE